MLSSASYQILMLYFPTCIVSPITLSGCKTSFLSLYPSIYMFIDFYHAYYSCSLRVPNTSVKGSFTVTQLPFQYLNRGTTAKYCQKYRLFGKNSNAKALIFG